MNLQLVKNIARNLCLLSFFCLVPIQVFAQYTTVDPYERHLSIVSLEDGSKPVFFSLNDEILFTFKPNFTGRPRHVALAFEHENFSQLHTLERNEQGVFFIYVNIPESLQEELGTLKYRYVVDGVWLLDPNNPETMQEPGGFALSTLQFPSVTDEARVSPLIIDAESSNKLIRFYIYSESGQEIYLSGSFSNWDPYMYRMRENAARPGYYYIDIRLRPGEYHYYFLKNGVRILDPQNTMIGFDGQGYQYSRVVIES
jgi:hypothetical protein